MSVEMEVHLVNFTIKIWRQSVVERNPQKNFHSSQTRQFFLFLKVLSWLTAAFNKKLISKSPERVIRKPAEQVSTLTIFYNLQNFSKSYQL